MNKFWTWLREFGAALRELVVEDFGFCVFAYCAFVGAAWNIHQAWALLIAIVQSL